MRFSKYQLAHLCVLAFFLLGFSSMGHLTWKECLRLACLLIGLAFLFFRYRQQLTLLASENPDLRFARMASMVLAALLAFVVTQFDPMTSAVAYLTFLPHLSHYFWFSSVLVGILGGLFFVSGWWRVRLKQLSQLDKIILVLVFILVSITVGAQLIITHQISAISLLSTVKILSYLILWFVLTHIYTVAWGNHKDVFGDVNRWRIVLVSCLVLFGTSIVYGAYRTGSVIYHFRLGQEALQSQRISDALNYYEYVRALNQSVDLRYIRNQVSIDLAVLYLKTDRVDDAQKMMASIADYTYEDNDVLVKKGEIYRRSGQWGSAIDVYKAYLNLAGTENTTLDYLAEAYVNTKNSLALEQLIAENHYAPKIDVQGYENHIFLGNFYSGRNQFDLALKHYALAQELDSNAYVLYKMGRVYFQQMEYQKAEEILFQATALMPNFADAFYWLGQSYKMQSQVDAAYGMYLKTIELLPQHLDGLIAVQNAQSLP